MNRAQNNHEAQASARIGMVLREKYRLDTVLGIGGMASVYAATHRNQKRFAVKVLHPEISRDEEVRRRFLREGYVANGVGHPGAVAVLDDDVAEDGSAFLVMELLEGLSVETVWERARSKLSPLAVLSIAVQLLDALEAAHAKGIVHRDIKPANLIVQPDGSLKILDFGIARLADTPTAAHATGSGMVLGTPAFMAPEQALGRSAEIGAGTDIWAVGALMFALLSGRTVHEGASGAELMVKAGSAQARSLAEVAPSVPQAVIRVVDRALAFAAQDRWPSAAAMRDAANEAHRDLFGAPASREALIELIIESTSTGTMPPPVDALAATAASQPAHLRSAPTPVIVSNLTTAKPLSRPGSRTAASSPTRWSRRRAGRLALTTAAVLAVLGLGARQWLHERAGRGPTGDAGQRDAGSAKASLVMTDLPVPSTPVPSAAADYRAALQAYRDGDLTRALQLMEQASTADPSMAAAYLRLAIWTRLVETDPSDETRAAFARARELRGSLDDRDRAIVAAFEPYLQIPTNIPEWRARLSTLAHAHPHDAEILYFEAVSVTSTWSAAASAKPWGAVLAVDPDFGMVWGTKLFGDLMVGDLDTAKGDAAQCLRIDPQSTSCLYFRSVAEAALGECGHMETSSRALMSKSTNTERWLRVAIALAGKGEPREAYARAIDQALRAAKSEDARRLVEEEYGARVALLGGAFGDAERAAVAIVQSSPQEEHLDQANMLLVQIADETGIATQKVPHGMDLWKTRSVGGGHLAALDPVRESHLLDPQLGRRLVRAKQVAPGELASAVAGWTRDLAESNNNQGDLERAWLYLQADPAGTQEEASAALAALGHPVTLGLHADAGLAAHILGRLYFLAGRFDDALAPLEAATHSCDALLRPVEQTQEFEMLGEVREARNDTAGACKAYGLVVERWGKAVPSSVTAAKAKARRAALGCRG